MLNWLKERWTSSPFGVVDIWCVGCKAHTKIMDVEYVEKASKKRVIRRAVGTCSSCGKTASSIVG